MWFNDMCGTKSTKKGRQCDPFVIDGAAKCSLTKIVDQDLGFEGTELLRLVQIRAGFR
jgi:hypothetical protein